MTDLPASTAPAAAAHPLVQGRCPACNGSSLFLGSGGYVTCSRLDCPDPCAADDQLHRGRADAETVLARITAYLDSTDGPCCETVRRALRGIIDGQAAPQATDAATTTRVFAALHQSAEHDVTRSIDLYERWLAAGAPPLGTSIARWWDRRLIELHDAIRPPAEQPRTTTDNAADDGPTVRDCAADDRRWFDGEKAGEQL